MIRGIVRSLIFLVLLCAVGGYLFYLKTGSSPFSGGVFTFGESGDSPDLRRLSEMPALNSVNSVDTDQTIQKWQDEKGVWHFSNKPMGD
jgi:hypothetical protein